MVIHCQERGFDHLPELGWVSLSIPVPEGHLPALQVLVEAARSRVATESKGELIDRAFLEDRGVFAWEWVLGKGLSVTWPHEFYGIVAENEYDEEEVVAAWERLRATPPAPFDDTPIVRACPTAAEVRAVQEALVGGERATYGILDTVSDEASFGTVWCERNGTAGTETITPS